MLLLNLLVNLCVVDRLFLVSRGRGQEHEEVVPLLRRSLRRRAGVDLSDGDVIDDHFGVVFRSPLLRVNAVEPLVIAGDEVTPLDDLQGLAGSARLVRKEKRGAARRESAGRGELPELPAGEPALAFFRHGDLLLSRRSGRAGRLRSPNRQIFVPDVPVLGLTDEQASDHEAHQRDDDRIPEARVDVAA